MKPRRPALPNPDVEELLQYNRDGIKAECARRGHPNRKIERHTGYCDDCRTVLSYYDLIWLGDFDTELADFKVALEREYGRPEGAPMPPGKSPK